MNDEMATTADLRDLRRLIHEVTGYRLLTRSEVHQITIILEHAVDRELAKAVMEQAARNEYSEMDSGDREVTGSVLK